MIIKSYEISKINLNNNKFVLFYGKNEGLKNQAINNLIKEKDGVSVYDEREVLENQNIFLENVFSKSFFETKKIIIIKRATDKILKIIDELFTKNLEDFSIIINADSLEKKSKLRAFFEKTRECTCVPFYPYLKRFSKRTLRDFGRLEIPSKPFFSASFKE